MTEPKRRTNIPAEVTALCTMWGNYKQRPVRTTDEGPQGFPKESPFVKASRYGELGIPQESNVRVVSDPDPPYVQQMDRIVSAMPKELSEVITMQYCPPVNEFHNNIDFPTKARMLALSPSTYRNRLESAHWFVFARMYP